MSIPTYAEAAEELHIPWCRGIKPNGQSCFGGHRPGFLFEGQVHWTDRRVSRAGLRRFLFLGAMLQTGTIGMKGWRRHYAANRLVTDWLKALRVEMPKSITAPYKAQVKAMLAAVPPGDQEREEAWAWASW
jgi:hypothetical protein